MNATASSLELSRYSRLQLLEVAEEVQEFRLLASLRSAIQYHRSFYILLFAMP